MSGAASTHNARHAHGCPLVYVDFNISVRSLVQNLSCELACCELLQVLNDKNARFVRVCIQGPFCLFIFKVDFTVGQGYCV